MNKKILSLLLIFALTFSLILTGCAGNTQETQPTTEAATEAVQEVSGEKAINDYLATFVSGDSPVYGTWEIEDFNYVSFIFRNDGLAEMAMGTEGNFTELILDENKKTLKVSFILGLNGEYTYELSDDNNTMTLDLNGTKTVLTRKDAYDFIPDPPKKPVIDKAIVGWWKGENSQIYHFGADGIMYSNNINIETCYTYDAENGKITALYDLGGEVTDEIEYNLTKNGKLKIEGNKYSKFDPFE